MPAPEVQTRNAPPALRVLGAPVLAAAPGDVAFTAERPFQLLAYLAVKGGWVRRDELADLLYPGRPLEAARNNLRKVLLLARRVAGEGAIEQNGDLLRWQPDSDLARFEQACDAGRHADAVAWYGGPLLHGLDAGWSADGAAWLAAERTRLEGRWREAALRRLGELEADPPAAEALAHALLRHDPLDDEAMQALLAAQGRQGRAGEALQRLDGYASQLAGALGLPPSAALQQLAGTLRRGVPPPPAMLAAQPEDAPLIGRRHELAQLRERFERADCRLLTVLGPGGIGKTALARAALEQVLTPQFNGGAAWAGLEALTAPAEVPARIAAAFGVAPPPHDDPWAALAAALRSRGDAPIALVLDNLEHLPLAREIAALLAAVPALRILATSRHALGIAGEWRLPLAGLPMPDDDERDAEVLRANDAVRLFERHALPLAPDFRLEAEAADVVHLVREVEGMPLALRLLAGWRRLMPVREILSELAGSLDVLEPSTPQDRSLRAAFERSWRQLGAHEQRVLAQMALLPQPLPREMLRAVLQAPLPVLAALADRSLVRAEGDGRFALHALIRRCAEPLATDADAVRERHARHLASTVSRLDAVDETTVPHVLAAWAWAVAQPDLPVLEALADAVALHHTRSARVAEGAHTLRSALQVIEPGLARGNAGPPPEAERAAIPVLQGLADMAYARGELDAALAASERALALASRRGDALRSARAHQTIGRVHWQRGRYEAAREQVSRQLALLREAAVPEADTVGALTSLGLMEKALGRFDEALAHYRQALAIARAHGRLARHLALANNLASLLRSMGLVNESLALLHEALALARASGELSNIPFLLVNVALAQEAAGAGDAPAWAEQAVAACREHGEPYIEAAALLCRARLGAQRGHGIDKSGADIRAALVIARTVRLVPLTVQCLATAGLVLARGSDPPAGLAIVCWAMEHPEFARSEREDMRPRLHRLAPSAEALARARAALAPSTPPEAVLDLLPAAWRP